MVRRSNTKTDARAKVERDPRWKKVVRRTSAPFFYSVATTGVYCRPDCGARTPNPENVAFYECIEDAERAGFRPCKRCKPGAPSLAEEHRALVLALAQHIDAQEETPSLAELAKRANKSPSHAARIFSSITGLSLHAYARASKAERARALLEKDERGVVTSAVYQAGYRSTSRFYERTRKELGMTPTQYRKRGKGVVIRFMSGPCSLGTVLVGATDLGVCCILLGENAHELERDLRERFSEASFERGDKAFARTLARVVRLTDHPNDALGLPLDLIGTLFQRRVWQALTDIPPGTTTTYTEVAKRTFGTRAVRAVASACGKNPIAIAVPCHRVVRKTGELAGYRWGLVRKEALLARERAPEARTAKRRHA